MITPAPFSESSFHGAALEKLTLLVGNTPLYRFDSLSDNPDVAVYAKLEWLQLGGSVKARAAMAIIQDALKSDTPNGRRLLDASSGNTGIAYGTICASLGLPMTLCLPENASAERKTILAGLGVDVVFTSPFEGTDGAQEVARKMADEQPERYLYLDQYNNPANALAHYHGTALEIWEQTRGEITHFVSPLGTTGTFTGTSRRLGELNTAIERVALQPESALHGMEGWKHLETARIPGIYDASLVDRHARVSTEKSYEMLRKIARDEGMTLSPSSAASLAGAAEVAAGLEHGVVVTVLADDAAKYGEVVCEILKKA
jgi:cysteine synthase B